MKQDNAYTTWLEDIGAEDTARVGGKNASLGEMIRALKDEGIQVPDGFATTAEAYRALSRGERSDAKNPGSLE